MCRRPGADLIPSPGLTGWTGERDVRRERNLWVTRSLGNVVERYDRAGRRTASVPVESPGAVRMGPRGRLYVTSGNSPLNMVRCYLRRRPSSFDRVQRIPARRPSRADSPCPMD